LIFPEKERKKERKNQNERAKVQGVSEKAEQGDHLLTDCSVEIYSTYSDECVCRHDFGRNVNLLANLLAISLSLIAIAVYSPNSPYRTRFVPAVLPLPKPILRLLVAKPFGDWDWDIPQHRQRLPILARAWSTDPLCRDPPFAVHATYFVTSASRLPR
jgi:hypothetical protein